MCREESAELDAAVSHALEAANAAGFAAPSIELGGATVLAADDSGLEALRAALPQVTRGRVRFPLVLPGHSAFHTPLMAPMARCLDNTPAFSPPSVPMVDGSGRVWPVGDECDTAALRQYTIDEQVVTPYRFARSIEVRHANSPAHI